MKNYSNYETRKVVITVDKNVTLARIFDNNNKVVSKGVAKCSPEDTFDFQMGAELAMTRAFESIPKKEPAKKYRKINRQPRPGDYMKIIKSCYTIDKPGDILKISEVYRLPIGYIVYVRHGNHPAQKKLWKDELFFTDNFTWAYNTALNSVEFLEKV